MNEVKSPATGSRPDPLNRLLGLVVFLVSLIVYFLTVQRTLSFWDCGEFITCAHVLGVPHPPGTPLFVLIGRIFSFFPIGDDPSFRINIISCIASAFAAMFGYFTATWLIRRWFGSGDLTGWRRITVYLGGLIGGFFFAFGRTNWGNSVEAEVYGTSMLFMMVTIYLMLLWIDNRSNPKGEMLLVAMAYLATLALGVHMTSFIVVPVAFLLIILVDEDYRKSWQIWVTYVVLSLVVYEVRPFLIGASSWAAICCIVYYWRHMARGWVYTLALPLIVFGILTVQGEPFVPVYVSCMTGWSLITMVVLRLHSSSMYWRISFLVITFALLGYSVQLFIPFRAAQDPPMNMNDPEGWHSFESFLERKQYGSENMLARAVEGRRGLWKNQFGTHPRMGFWGFFDDQYGINGRRFLIVFVIGLYGLYYAIKKHWKSGIFIFLITLAGTVGLVIYMNFADGTHENALIGEGHLEVRDRDYFWTPGFVMFGLLIGMGVAAIFDLVRTAMAQSKVSRSISNAVLGTMCILILLPGFALAANYHINDRHDNFIPYDYAWNILQSARPNAVLFTNGDNDTFPVWCLQMVYGVRPDVKIANLSLINTHWYIKQLKEQGVPIGLSDDQIDGLVHRRMSDGSVNRVQDQMIVEIIDENNRRENEYPVSFAITVSSSNKNYKKRPLDPYLQMEGMALVSTYPKPQPDAVNIEKTKELYVDTFRYRGVTDSSIYKDENADRLVGNYISGFLFMADTLQRAGKVDEAADILKTGMDKVGGGDEVWLYMARMYAAHGRTEDVDRLLEEAPEQVPRNDIRLFAAASFVESGHKAEARKYLEDAYAADSDSREVFNELFRYYFEERMENEMANLLQEYVERHPGDQQLDEALRQLKAEAPELFTRTDMDSSSDTGRHVRVLDLDSASSSQAVDSGAGD